VGIIVINFAIIGCGHIAKKHAEAIRNTEGAQLIAVCDKVEENMVPFEEDYQVQAYRELDELLKNEDVHVVCICTPSGSHAPIAVQAAKAKKHVVVEKPIALKVEDADRIIAACDENKVKLSVVHPNRFRPAIMALKKVMDKNLIGKISHANATVRWNRNQAYYDQAVWRGTKEYDGGVLMNQAIHNLDLLLWLVGDIEEVYSMSATRLRDIEAEDVSTGVCKFVNGALGVVEAATTIYPKNLEETISIFGEKGTVKISGTTANLIEHWNIESMDEQETRDLIAEIVADPIGKSGHQCIIEDMIQAIKYDCEPIVNGQDGKKALQFVTSMYESAENDSTIKIKHLTTIK
jgi:UDP-N-acetyl-2-amino-2-deoxyglucuronate dehydrogenase